MFPHLRDEARIVGDPCPLAVYLRLAPQALAQEAPVIDLSELGIGRNQPELGQLSEPDAQDLGRVHDRWQVANAVRVHCGKAAGHELGQIARGEAFLQQVADILAVRVPERNEPRVSEGADVLEVVVNQGSEFHGRSLWIADRWMD